MRLVSEILASSELSGPLARGRRLLVWRRAAGRALAELGEDFPCDAAAGENGALELRVRDAAAATRLRQRLPSFLAAFNRLAQTELRSARVRVFPAAPPPDAGGDAGAAGRG